MIVLKSNTGTEENRARQLKYSVKINDLLIKRTLRDEDITLFDPKDVPELLTSFGEEFEKKYIEYEQKAGLRKQVMPAKDVVALIFKERAETGNIYLFHEENVNQATLLNRYVNSSNLCCEIVLPSRASSLNKEYVYHADSKTDLIISESTSGEIALVCMIHSSTNFDIRIPLEFVCQVIDELSCKEEKYIDSAIGWVLKYAYLVLPYRL